MNRFIDLNGRITNVDFIRKAWEESEETIAFELNDEQVIRFRTKNNDWYFDKLYGTRHIVQVIQPTTKMYDVYKNDDGTYDAVPVKLLVLCADGNIYSANFDEGFLDFSECSNHEGVFPKERLKYYFKNIEFCDEEDE